MRADTASVLTALEQKYGADNVAHGKGGFWIRGDGPTRHITLAQARRETGLAATPRQKRPKQAPWGDYATIAMMNRRRNPRQIDDDKDILIDIFTEGDGSERWVKETTCTLAEFFAENETVDRDEVRPKLFMRGQYVDGGGASVLWKIAFHK